jgi:hypothetical protein
MRLALTVLALVLDLLCLLLMGAIVVFSHPARSEALGLAILGTVVAGNIPALVWGLLPRRRADASPATAGVFD